VLEKNRHDVVVWLMMQDHEKQSVIDAWMVAALQDVGHY
jgi:predicted Fe-S protein YdhL (DUF1289 family)